MTNLAHSPLGPSSADRWLNCPASVRMTEHLPDVTSQYAAEGTAAHDVAEECKKTDALPHTFLGKKYLIDGVEIEVDQEMVEGVQFFLDHLNDLPPGVDYNESRVHYGRWVKNGFGTLDRARVAGNVVYIRDLKYGKGIKKFAKENPQLMLYAAGFLEEFGWMLDEIDTFNLGIVQPRLEWVDEWTISKADLLKWMDEVAAPGAKETENPKADFKAGEHCQFCKIKSTCMVRASSVFKEVVGDFANLDEAIAETAKLPVEEALQPFLTPDQVARALRTLPQIKAWCKDLEAHAMREVQAGRDVGGWYLTEGRGGNRTWALDEKALQAAAVQSGVHDLKVLYAAPKLLTPAALEGVIGKRHPFFKLQVVDKPPGKPVLVPPSDGRPPLSVDALKEFSALGDE